MDDNRLYRPGAMNAPVARMRQQSGRDEHSIMADTQFVDPARGDYRVQAGSPALELSFVNFPMDEFGVQKPDLKAIARTPQLPAAVDDSAVPAARDPSPRAWLGAIIRNIANEGEMSAFGLPGVPGVLVLEVSATSALANAGLQKNDVILSVGEDKTEDVTTLLRQVPVAADGRAFQAGIRRHPMNMTLPLEPLK